MGVILLISFLALIGSSSAQLTQFGQCESLSTMNDFNLASFVGTWYEIGKASSSNPACSYLEFANPTSGITVATSAVNNNFLETDTGTAVLTTGTSVFTITLSSSTTPIDFWVLASDYTNYAIAYNCVNVGTTQRQVNVWQLGRSTTTYNDAAIVALANTALTTIGVTSVDQLQSIDHTTDGCTQLPVIEAGQPIILTGQCSSTISVVENFDVENFVGTWHEIQSYYSENALGTCSRADYTLVDSVVNVVNSQVVNEALDTISGTATQVGTGGTLSVTLNVQGVPITQELLVLATDYSSYAVSYSCVNLANNQRRVNSWILSRQKTLSTTAQTAVNQVINSFLDLNDRYFTDTDQSDTGCFYFPTVQAGVPVVFPGQCDASIPAVANFDATRYEGLWHNIESYPSTFQQGTCNNANYTLSDDTVIVFNTQVVNQALDTMTGTAVVSSTDGTAKLTVTFPIAGTDQTTSTPYWVLATDYESYSLVYTCVDLADDQRIVWSWKLSRTKQLTIAANTAINAVMSTINVLDSRYYEDNDQSDNACFYFPEPQDGVPVVFPGQCDLTIPAVANFDVGRYMGQWFDISSYPSTFQQGSCNTAQYTSLGDVVVVYNTQVVNEELDTINGTGVVATTDGTGKLEVSFPIAGTNEVATTPYWVLATDYDSYSLVYTCYQINDDQRAVWGWKLSRTQSLSTTANTAINNAMTNIPVLDERYFVDNDHSANGCFYYPNFEENEAIILPGSCPTIPGQANFNAEAYLGNWYEIARYPQVAQTGQCSRAEYDLVNGVVTVRNNEVSNGTLEIQEGTAVAAADGSGVLTVTFNVNGVVNVAIYTVLETDYTSYALVYSCRDLDNGDRQVFSWKLSRSRTLTNEANNAIAEIINSTQGLRDDYYMSTSQSDDDCFYVPEPTEGESAIFRGQCSSVTGVQNFDITRFLGWWHEIESYPSENVSGSCNSLNFRMLGSQFQAIETVVSGNTSVVNLLNVVWTVNGRLDLSSSQGTTTYWVLDTDYDSYALLYTCENINSDYRRVWSAKYSKSRSLTDAAENAINSVITQNQVQVLFGNFYISVDQSDAACFHYRELTGEQVIIPGQCDSSIPVQTSFDLAQFVGTWYQLERYPYPQVSNNGTCVGSRFTLKDDGDVSVLNWEVLDGTLNTLEGTASVTPAEARLTVTLPVQGSQTETTTTNLYILGTDYSSYALAYSCENVNAYERTVGAFKLSRTRTMPAAGQTAIEAYMASRDEFYQPYFIQIEQNDDCDDPNSALLVKSSIIVMLVSLVLQLFI